MFKIAIFLKKNKGICKILYEAEKRWTIFWQNIKLHDGTPLSSVKLATGIYADLLRWCGTGCSRFLTMFVLQLGSFNVVIVQLSLVINVYHTEFWILPCFLDEHITYTQ